MADPFRPPWRVVIALALGAGANAADYQGPPSVRTAVGYEFGTNISFVATILSDSPVARAAVFYRPAGSSDTKVLVADLVSGTPTLAQAEQDLRRAPLPPFQLIESWWQVDFVDRTSVTTPVESVRYEDDRFDWQFLTEQPLAVHWAQGDLDFARGALNAGAEGLDRIQGWLLPAPVRPIQIYVYPDVASLQFGLELAGRTWTAGHADPELSLILAPVAPSPEAAQAFERLIPHELAHLVLYERMGNTYASLPAWLNEGLATSMEISPDPRYRAALDHALAGAASLSLESLCAGFPNSGEGALLAYAQSTSFVGYLRDVYGIGSIHALLDAYQEGASCMGGLERVFRRAPEVIEREWLIFAAASGPATGVSGWVWGLLIVTIGGVALAWAIRRRRTSGSLIRDDSSGPEAEDN